MHYLKLSLFVFFTLLASSNAFAGQVAYGMVVKQTKIIAVTNPGVSFSKVSANLAKVKRGQTNSVVITFSPNIALHSAAITFQLFAPNEKLFSQQTVKFASIAAKKSVAAKLSVKLDNNSPIGQYRVVAEVTANELKTVSQSSLSTSKTSIFELVQTKKPDASTIVVGDITVSNTTVSQGDTIQYSGIVTAKTFSPSNGSMVLHLINAAGQDVRQNSVYFQELPAGVPTTITDSFVIPADFPIGTYSLIFNGSSADLSFQKIRPAAFQIISRVNAACGTSAGVAAIAAPVSNLCTAGSASVVQTGATSFTWSCLGLNGGTNAACTAPVMIPATNAACGANAGIATVAAPVSNLCATGSASVVQTGATSFTWSCVGLNGGTNAACTAPKTLPATNATCGASAGLATVTAPITGLCAAGNTSVVQTGTTSFTWTCLGLNGGTNAACTAPKTLPVTNAICGTSAGIAAVAAPVTGLCTAGSASVVQTGATTFTWSCLGLNGGTNAACTAPKTLPATNAACGANAGIATVAAPVTGLCAAGSASVVQTGTTSFTWSCLGLNGGTNAACTAPKTLPATNAACGTSAGVGTVTAPATGLCTAGSASAVQTGTTSFTWTCLGLNGGTNAACTAGRYVTIGDFVNYPVGSYNAYNSAWGKGSLVAGVDFNDKMIIDPSQFPNNTDIQWSWPNTTPAAGGVYGYMEIGYGGAPIVKQPVPSKTISSINTLSETLNLTFTGQPENYDVITDIFLTSNVGHNWDEGNEIAEIGVFHHTPPATIAWLHTSGTVIGTYTDASGRIWNVTKADKYIQFIPQNAVDAPTGVFDLKAMFMYLVGKHVLSGSEYFNGLDIGSEPFKGTGSMHVTTFDVTYN